MSKRFKGKTCVYCATPVASETGDHVLAREFVPVAYPSQIPQVPACRQCNKDKADLEHYLTAVLLFGGRHADAATNLGAVARNRAANDPDACGARRVCQIIINVVPDTASVIARMVLADDAVPDCQAGICSPSPVGDSATDPRIISDYNAIADRQRSLIVEDAAAETRGAITVRSCQTRNCNDVRRRDVKYATCCITIDRKVVRSGPEDVHVFRDEQFAAGERDFRRGGQHEVNRVAVVGASEGGAQRARAAVGSVGDGNRRRAQVDSDNEERNEAGDERPGYGFHVFFLRFGYGTRAR